MPGWLGLARDAPVGGWDSLPQHILVQILAHVPVQDRFRHAALVGVDWAEAAVTATTDVCMPHSRCLNLGNFQSWLVQHSASSTGQSNSLTAISLTSHADQELVVLPCPKLRRLDLADMSVQLLPTAGGLFPGALRGVSALTRFTLQHASVVGGPQTLTGKAPCAVSFCRRQHSCTCSPKCLAQLCGTAHAAHGTAAAVCWAARHSNTL